MITFHDRVEATFEKRLGMSASLCFHVQLIRTYHHLIFLSPGSVFFVFWNFLPSRTNLILLQFTGLELQTTLHCRDCQMFHKTSFKGIDSYFTCSKMGFNVTAPAYGVYISQLINYSSFCASNEDFIERGLLLTRKLMGFSRKA